MIQSKLWLIINDHRFLMATCVKNYLANMLKFILGAITTSLDVHVGLINLPKHEDIFTWSYVEFCAQTSLRSPNDLHQHQPHYFYGSMTQSILIYTIYAQELHVITIIMIQDSNIWKLFIRVTPNLSSCL